MIGFVGNLVRLSVDQSLTFWGDITGHFLVVLPAKCDLLGLNSLELNHRKLTEPFLGSINGNLARHSPDQ